MNEQVQCRRDRNEAVDSRAISECLAVTLPGLSVGPFTSTVSTKFRSCCASVVDFGEGALHLTVRGQRIVKGKHKQACVTGPGHGRYESIVQSPGSVTG